jgi:serine/threonine protein kinase
MDEFGFELPEGEWIALVRRAALTEEHSSADGGAEVSPTAELPDTASGNPLLTHRATVTISNPTTGNANRAIPDSIGAYRVLRELGRGGMGVVYEAEQPSPQRIVALKVMRPGIADASALRRFALEAHVLGRLQHAGIAQVFEAGIAVTADGQQPYFAMELIRGRGLREFVQEQHLGTRARLELMATIGDAVHYAHQRGVIHRDLKPGNILVDGSGQPKVLDFGVARATDCDMQVTTLHTDVGQLIGTLPYMSPEQVSADPAELDVRSDVFALGVVTYELLSGRLPFNLKGKMIHEAARIIREDEPERLSTHDHVLRGDVETIVAKTMAKDKDSRYASAAEFVADIRRYLHDEPIVARPSSAAYQFRKFARRHRAFVGAAAGIGLSILIGFITSTLLYLQSESRRAEAEYQRNIATMIQTFLQDMLAEADPRRTQRHEITIREVLDAAAIRLENEFGDHPEVRAAIEQTIGESYYGLMDFELAIPRLSTAVRMLRDLGHADTVQLADALHLLGESYSYLGRGDGVPLMREVLAIRTAQLGPGHPDTAAANQYLGFALFRKGLAEGGRENLLTEAERRIAEALELLREHPGATDEQLARCWHLHGIVLGFMGRQEESLRTLREVLVFQRQTFGVHPYTWDCIDDLGLILERNGLYSEAAETHGEAVDMGMTLFGPRDEKVAVRANRMGRNYQQLADWTNAERAFKTALDICSNAGDTGSSAALLARVYLSDVYVALGQRDEGLAQLHQAVQDWRASVNAGNDNMESTSAVAYLATQLSEMNDPHSGETLLRDLADIRTTMFGQDHELTLQAVHELGLLLRTMDRPLEAAALFHDGWQVMRDRYGRDNAGTLLWLGNHAASLHDARQLTEAELRFREIYAAMEGTAGSEDRARAAIDVAIVLRDQEHFDEALPYAREAVDIRTRIRGRHHERTAAADAVLVSLLVAAGQIDEAVEIRTTRYQEAVKTGGAMVEEAFEHAEFLRQLKRAEEAAAVYRKGWESLRSADGVDPPVAVRWMRGYIKCLKDLNRVAEAIDLQRTIAAIAIRADGPAAKDAFRLGALLRKNGQREEAGRVFLSGWQAMQLEDGTTSFKGLVWMGNYAATQLDMGRVDVAEPLFRKAYEAYKLENPVSRSTGRGALDLSIALHQMGNEEEAVELASEALQIRRRHFGQNHDAIIDTARWLAELLERLQRFNEAEPLRLEVVSMRAASTAAARKEAIAEVIDCYVAWDTLEPDAGHDEQAEKWRAEHAMTSD